MNLNVNLSNVRAGVQRLNINAPQRAQVEVRRPSQRIDEAPTAATESQSATIERVEGKRRVAFNNSGDTLELGHGAHVSEDYLSGLFNRVAARAPSPQTQTQQQLSGQTVDESA